MRRSADRAARLQIRLSSRITLHAMRLSGLRRHWNEFGRSDPLWAILTAPDKKGNRWSVDEFLQTGRDEIAALDRLSRCARAHRPSHACPRLRMRRRPAHPRPGRLLRSGDRRRHRPVDDRRCPAASCRRAGRRVPRQCLEQARVDRIRLGRPGLHAPRASAHSAALRPRIPGGVRPRPQPWRRSWCFNCLPAMRCRSRSKAAA